MAPAPPTVACLWAGPRPKINVAVASAQAAQQRKFMTNPTKAWVVIPIAAWDGPSNMMRGALGSESSGALEPFRAERAANSYRLEPAVADLSTMDPIKNILFFVVLTAILCAIILFEIRSERRRFFEPAPSSPRSHRPPLFFRAWRERSRPVVNGKELIPAFIMEDLIDDQAHAL